MSTEWLEAWIPHLRPGITEIMVHPGYVDDALRRTGTRLLSSRADEVDLLCSTAVQALVAANDIQLIRHDLEPLDTSLIRAFAMSRKTLSAHGLELSVVVPLFNKPERSTNCTGASPPILLLIGLGGGHLRGRWQHRRHRDAAAAAFAAIRACGSSRWLGTMARRPPSPPDSMRPLAT
jgi:hypothetical protein